jgi:hypothetical protein
MRKGLRHHRKLLICLVETAGIEPATSVLRTPLLACKVFDLLDVFLSVQQNMLHLT